MNLPNVFQNRKITIEENGQNVFYGSNPSTPPRRKENKEIKMKIKELFASKRYVYKVDCMIETNKEKRKTSLIGQTTGNLITIDNELIPIKEIIDIYEV